MLVASEAPSWHKRQKQEPYPIEINVSVINLTVDLFHVSSKCPKFTNDSLRMANSHKICIIPGSI